jgi:hypothetical protein
MNDPHVVSLIYRIEHSESVDFDEAPAQTVPCGGFRVTLDAGKARFEMVDHFASEQEARQVVERFLHQWEFVADLRDAMDQFRFIFENADVIDRSPSKGAVDVVAGTGQMRVHGFAPGVHVGRGRWPDSPQNLELSFDADAMWRRWLRYRNGGEPLLAAAYWALTVIEAAPEVAASSERSKRPSGTKRQGASAFFNVDLAVLDTLGELTSTRGGNEEERKAEGRLAPLSAAERQWIEAAFRALVRRVAEQAYHKGPPPDALTMDHLPNLTP